MKRPLLTSAILSIALFLALTPLGAVSHVTKFSISCVAYTVLTVYLLRKNPTKVAPIILILVLPVILIYGPIHLGDPVGALFSLLSAIAPLIGIAVGFSMVRSGSVGSPTAIFLLLANLSFVQFYAYERWIHYLNFGTFSGKTHLAIPDLIFTNEDGQTISSDFKNKTIILDFWNTACGVCFTEFPAL